MRFELRKWRLSDVPGVARYANNEKIAQNLRDVFPHPYTEVHAKSYLESCIAGEGSIFCRAIAVNGEAVGSIGVFPCSDVYKKSAELGYWLAEDYWSRGIMTEAVKQICQEAFAVFDIVRIFAEPFSHNIGSCKVLEKAGFTYEGTMKSGVYKSGQIYDYCMYALLRP